jgi:hypothetical protein
MRVLFANPARDEFGVSQYSLLVLRSILEKASITSITITSVIRTPRDQARIMYQNISRYGIAHQKRLYGRYGDRVIEACANLMKSGKSPEEVIAGMTKEITDIGPGKVSRHVGDPTKINVIDVDPASIDTEARPDFELAVKADSRVSAFLLPPDDPAVPLGNSPAWTGGVNGFPEGICEAVDSDIGGLVHCLRWRRLRFRPIKGN